MKNMKALTRAIGSIVVLALILAAVPGISPAAVVKLSLETKLVPGPVNYWVMLPDGYESSTEKYPLFLFLHGGGGYNNFLQGFEKDIRKLSAANRAPRLVIVTPECGRSLYMDYRDGSEKWETFIVTELLPLLRKKFRIKTDRERTFIGGISMGGMGSLRMGLKYPDTFGAIVSFEPGIEPALEWKDVELEDKFYRPEALLEERFGSPIDEAYWRLNNPASIVRDNAQVIRKSGIKIYIEVGTDDMVGLYRGTDFLHRQLFDLKIPHEYRLVLGADHVGPSLVPRIADGLAFLKRIMNPPPRTVKQIMARRFFNRLKREAGLID